MTATPALVNALQDKSPTVRSSAAYALVRVGKGKAFCRNRFVHISILGDRKMLKPSLEFKTFRYRIFCKKVTRISRTSGVLSGRIRVRETLVAYQNTKPLVICRIPVINNILWKCSKNSSDKKPDNQEPQTVRGQQNSQPSQRGNR